MNSSPILSAKKISKTYFESQNLPILTNIDLEIYAGDSLAIVGKSGEGKSTLLHILGGLTTFDQGQLDVCGHRFPSPHSHKIRNQHIGFIFQSYHLFAELSVLDNVLLPAKIAYKNTKKDSLVYQYAKELLEEVNLGSKIFDLAKYLSGGEKQRVAIARALCNQPDLILADEPSGNLDSFNSLQIHELLIKMTTKFKKTLIVVTHDDTLSQLCQKTLILKQGKLCTS
ncbi:MAG: ABC transporter ATP-binding protein [Rhabdochlamydiaceae bacterium]